MHPSCRAEKAPLRPFPLREPGDGRIRPRPLARYRLPECRAAGGYFTSSYLPLFTWYTEKLTPSASPLASNFTDLAHRGFHVLGLQGGYDLVVGAAGLGHGGVQHGLGGSVGLREERAGLGAEFLLMVGCGLLENFVVGQNLRAGWRTRPRRRSRRA